MRRSALALLWLLASVLSAAEGDTYAAVLQAMQGHPHRHPGSPGYAAAVDGVEAALRSAGVDVQRLRYQTVAIASQAVLKVGSEPVPGVLAMAPNGVAPSTTWDGEVTGPLVWLGEGTLNDMRGKPVAGALALIRLGSPNLPQVFAQGARAVIAIDDGSADQWQTARMFTESLVSSPRAYLSRATAESQGLLGDKPNSGSLRISSAWQDVQATTLWALIPAAPGGDPVRSRQVVVLAAELATSGAVPDLAPGGRQAANAALLAELAARLQAAPADRTVLIAFLGSHYAAQDGARQLYWTINKAQQAQKDRETLASRGAWIAQQIAVCDRRLAILAGEQVLTASGDDAFQLRNQLRRIVTGRSNELNYRYRQVNLRLAGANAAKADAVPALAAESAEIKARIASANSDRRQVFEGVVTDHAAFRAICDAAAIEVGRLRSDLEREAARVGDAERLRAALDGQSVIAHFGIDFARADLPWFANPFGLSCKAVWGTDWSRKPQPGHFAKHIAAYQQAWNAIAASQSAFPPLRNPDQTVSWSFEALSTPYRRQVACVVPQGLGIMGCQLSSIGDALPHDEMPEDPSPALLALGTPVAAWLHQLLASDLPVRTGLAATQSYNDRLMWGHDGTMWTGMRFDRLAPGSDEVEGPADGALVYVRNGRMAPESAPSATVCGRINSAIGRVNAAGGTVMPNLISENARTQTYAVEFSQGGTAERFFNAGSGVNELNPRLFTGWGNGLYVPFMPDDYGVASAWQRLVGRTDSGVKRSFGEASVGGAMIVTDSQRPLKLLGNGLFVLGADSLHPNGDGVTCDAGSLVSLDVVRQSADDVSELNRHRLAVLRSKSLINRPVELINASCSTHLRQAHQARDAGDVQVAAAHETLAATLAFRAQVPLREDTNNLLQAVVYLLLLSIPFAFVLERLVLGAVSIYRQIAGFLAIFLATFALLYATHPAFALADAPIIIFLAFIIILLSAFVIVVVMGKFQHELKALQGLAARSHSAGTGNSTTMAAIIIGIAGMRNRPLKTFLTTITVTLLTFTILVFASFGSSYGVTDTWLGKSRGAERIEVHQKSFLTIPERLVSALEEVHGKRFEVMRRTASFADPLSRGQESPLINLVQEPASGATLKLDSLLGFDPREAERLGMFQGLARPGPGQPAPLWLSSVAAGQLKAAPGTRLLLRGRPFVLAGVFDEARLKAAENLDASRLTPPDFTATFAAAPIGDAGLSHAVENLDITSFIFSSPALAGVTTDDAVLAMGGMTNHLTLYPRDGRADIGRAAGEIAAVFNGPVYSTSSDGTRSWFYTRQLSGSGFGDLIIPLLLGGLIIFSSLLGSIVDRQKEIFTYSALGLSPRDVGTLFFAESAVIAIVGGMGGYLTGQLAAKLLNLMADHGLIAIPPLNFSSLASLATIGIVMAMVLLSTIYPAMMASRSANPGVNRSWKMPEPDGDTLRFTFPFTVPHQSFGGIVAFICEHFRSHGDAALDVFAAQEVQLYAVDATRVGIRAEISLAPFDLGVFQRFSMSTRPSDIPGIDEVVVELQRISGTPRAWMRGNRGFIADLREQFLIWRSLPPEAVAHYQAEAAGSAASGQGGSHVAG